MRFCQDATTFSNAKGHLPKPSPAPVHGIDAEAEGVTIPVAGKSLNEINQRVAMQLRHAIARCPNTTAGHVTSSHRVSFKSPT
ncbi:hypothetical protein NMY22_g12376 [Coprinellus aureogranulatus]|nr:hypothetical protein NMY22_g12376 [Coprinellus aureogranulatus]